MLSIFTQKIYNQETDTKNFCLYFLVGISGLTSEKSVAQVSGTIKIPGDYPTIIAELNQINAVGLSGPTILELQAK
jgi:hypothetical protein